MLDTCFGLDLGVDGCASTDVCDNVSSSSSVVLVLLVFAPSMDEHISNAVL